MTTSSTPSPDFIGDHLESIYALVMPLVRPQLDAWPGSLVSNLVLLAEKLAQVRSSGGHVYVCGNGGSCANAAHLVLHLREIGVKAFDLLADAPWVSAIANDRAYDQVFSWTLHALGAGPEDLLIVISGSGQSKNIMKAIEWAANANLTIAGLLGNAAHNVYGGAAFDHMDSGLGIVVPSDDYGVIEDVHSICIHALKKALTIPQL